MAGRSHRKIYRNLNMADHAGSSTPRRQALYRCIVEEFRARALQNLYLFNCTGVGPDCDVEDTSSRDVFCARVNRIFWPWLRKHHVAYPTRNSYIGFSAKRPREKNQQKQCSRNT